MLKKVIKGKMADWLIVSGYHNSHELYKQAIPRPETIAALLQINQEFAEQSVIGRNLLQDNSHLVLEKLQQKYKDECIDTYVDLPGDDFISNERFKPEYMAKFFVGVIMILKHLIYLFLNNFCLIPKELSRLFYT